MIQDLELAILRHRVLVLATEKLLVEEHVDAGREGAGKPSLIETYGPSILLTPKDELDLLFALPGLPPDGHGCRHEDAQDANADKQGSHGITAVPTGDVVLLNL